MITSYKEMPLGMYERLMDIVKPDASTEASNEQNIHIVALLSGITYEDVMNLTIDEFRKRLSAASFLLDVPAKAKVRSSYKVGGWVLRPVTDIRKMLTSQYTDFQEYTKAGKPVTSAEILSTLLVPDGKRYADGYDVVELQSDLREKMTVSDAYPLSAFFFKKFRNSMLSILRSSERLIRRAEVQTETKAEALSSLRSLASGDGWIQYEGSQTLHGRLGLRSTR